MITTSMTIKTHLAEYAKVVFEDPGKNYIRIPHQHDLYHKIADEMIRRPRNVPIRRGNLEIALPRQSRGKCPLTFNYISIRAARRIERKIERMFWAHVHDYVDELHHEQGYHMNTAIYMFMDEYKITGISEDALVKNYYRWRCIVRSKKKKRGYKTAEKKDY